MLQGFWIDSSNFSGKNDLFQVLGNRCRRLTYEGRKFSEVAEWLPENFNCPHYGGKVLPSIPEEFAGLF